MSAAKSLVTGGCGFIGHHLVELLRDSGDQVRVLDLHRHAQPLADVEYVQGSITDPEVLARCMRGVERVFHLAADPNLWAGDKSRFEQVNHLGTRKVLKAAETAGVTKIVYTSTESILQCARNEVIDEQVVNQLADMPGPYCRSKFLAEREALNAAARGVPVVVVNPTLPVGAGDFRLTPPTRMLLMFLNGRSPAYLDCELNFIDVRDVAAGHKLAAEQGRVGERYILGNENIRLSKLLAMLQALTGLRMPRWRIPYLFALGAATASEFIADHLTGKPPLAPITGVKLAGMPSHFDSSKAVRKLGLPQTSLTVSLTDTIRWFQQQGLLERQPSALSPKMS